ncbi:MAG: ABC transporter ATP-binding protein [Anaerolineae bacterium]|nr:ABC transporter ATP-binding protein [Anaerolineae bacterium]
MNENISQINLSSWGVLRRILGYTLKYKWYALVALVAIVIFQVLGVVIPDILRLVIDRGIQRRDSDYMLQAGLLVVVLGVLRGGIGFVARYFSEAQSHKVAFDIRNEMYRKMQRLPFVFHDRSHTGSLITRSLSDVDEVQRFLAFGLLDGLNTLLITGLAFAVMFYTSPVLAMVSILPMIPLLVRSQRFAAFVNHEWRRVMEHVGKLGDHLQESIVGAEVVRAFSREHHEIQRFAEENQRLYVQQLKVVDKWTQYIPFAATMTAVSIFLTLLVGGWLEQEGLAGVTVGVIVQFSAYILMISQPIRFFGFVIMLVNQAIASGRRVFEVLEEPETITDKPGALELAQAKGLVRFENVNFRYAPNLPYALQDINLTAEPGQIIALVGETGAGKSTLVNLIPRFYEVTEGRVTLDGHDVRDLTMRSLKDQIGIALQESLLFSATIRENIAFGRPNANEAAIMAAAKAADAHNFIMEFPDGYDTLVGERGITLSGGQRQRVAIARALLTQPAVLIMDDSTSAVDTQTEYSIQQALRQMMQGRTTFVIAQRLTSVMHADQILVIDQGRIAERGTHAELLQHKGLYRQIYDLQLADQERVRRETLDFSRISELTAVGD